MNCLRFIFSTFTIFIISGSSPAAPSGFCYDTVIDLAITRSQKNSEAQWLHLRTSYLQHLDPKFPVPFYEELAKKTTQSRPEYQPSVTERAKLVAVADGLRENSETFRRHISGEFYEDTFNGRRVNDGGLHFYLEWRDEILRRLPKLPKESADTYEGRRNFIERYMKAYCEGGFCPSRLFLVAAHSINPKEATLAVNLVDNKLMGTPQKLKNGVLQLRFAQEFFSAKGWEASKGVARSGTAPLGAKTFFPDRWSLDKIQKATLDVLANPQSKFKKFVLNSTGQVREALITGVHDNVELTVAIRNGKVISTYPTWYQEGTTGETKRPVLRNRIAQWGKAFEELKTVIHSSPDLNELLSDISPDELSELYFFEDSPDRYRDKRQIIATQFQRIRTARATSDAIKTDAWYKVGRVLNELRRQESELDEIEKNLGLP